jgi:hypothetical protein
MGAPPQENQGTSWRTLAPSVIPHTLPVPWRQIDGKISGSREVALELGAGTTGVSFSDFASWITIDSNRGALLSTASLTYPVQAPATKLPLQSASIDFVLYNATMNCLLGDGERRDSLKEVRRVLRESGSAYVADFLVATAGHYLDRYDETHDLGLPHGTVISRDDTGEPLYFSRHVSEPWLVDACTSSGLQITSRDYGVTVSRTGNTLHYIALLVQRQGGRSR